MKKIPASLNKSLRRAIGILCLSSAALVTVITPGTSLRAQQETTAAGSSPSVDRPSSLNSEVVDTLGDALAKPLNDLLSILFDSEKSVAERRAAAASLKATAYGIPSTPLNVLELKNHLLRIVALMDVALAATEVGSIDSTSTSQTSVITASSKVNTFLSSVLNGHAWDGYLFLQELKSGLASEETLKKAYTNLTETSSLNPEQRAFLRRPAFQELSAAIETTLAMGSFGDDVEKAKADRLARINQLVEGLLAYEKEPVETQAAKARSAWRVLRARYPSTASVLRHTVNSYYFNHNVHVTVSETLLSRLISDYRSESGCIADCVLGARVTGSQTTDVNVNVDVVPSSSTANFELKVSGNTRSDTKAVKHPATVWTSGNHYFWMNRHVSFDGRSVYATPANFSVDTNSQTVGLATKFDRIPILRGIVRKIATQKIAESKPQSEAITASKLREKALPEFERETNQQFSDGNQTLSSTMAALDRRGVAPDSISARSSNTHVAFSSRTIGTERLGGSLQPPSALIATGLSAQLHHSALNNAIDALGFHGKKVAEKDLVTEIEKALSELFQRDVKLTNGQPAPPVEGDEPDEATFFVFGEKDPIRVEFKDGRVIVILRTGIEQDGKEPIPQQTIRIPIKVALTGGKVLLEPGDFAIAGPGASRKPQIKRILDRRIVKKELSPTIDLQAAGDKTLPLTISYIELNDGWLTLEAQ